MNKNNITLVVDGDSFKPLVLLDPSAVFFVARETGGVDVVPKSSVSNLFRKDGEYIKYFAKGADNPPPNSAAYVTIEELEDITVKVTKADRKAAEDALTEDERRPDAQAPEPRRITDFEAPKREE